MCHVHPSQFLLNLSFACLLDLLRFTKCLFYFITPITLFSTSPFGLQLLLSSSQSHKKALSFLYALLSIGGCSPLCIPLEGRPVKRYTDLHIQMQTYHGVSQSVYER